jgi:hypothetical protein
MDVGLVKGEAFAVDASVIEADASHYDGKAPDDGTSSPCWLCVHGYLQSTMAFGSLNYEAAKIEVDALGLGPVGHGYVSGPASPGGGARKVEAGE